MARARLAAVLALFLCAPGLAQPDPPPPPVMGEVRFPLAQNRPWVSPSVHTNRLQDWELDGEGGLRCLEGRPRWPLRTAHLLTAEHDAQSGEVRASVVIEAKFGEDAPASALAGLVLGAGGPGIDPRLTSLIHHRPAADAGLLVAVDGRGELRLFDLGATEGKGGLWGLRGPLEEGELRPLDPVLRAGRFGFTPSSPLRLDVSLSGDRLRVDLSAVGGEQDFAALEAIVSERHRSGRFALVSHGSPARDRKGFGFRAWRVGGPGVQRTLEHRTGPVMAALHTLSRGTLKMTVQMVPLGATDSREGQLLLEGEDGEYEVAATSELNEDASTHHFRIAGWDASRPRRWRFETRIVLGDGKPSLVSQAGTIRAEPSDGELKVAFFTGTKHFTGGLRWNHSGIWFPHRDIFEAVAARDPDLLFWSGDQLYEGDLTPPIRAPFAKARLDYLERWFRWCRAFAALSLDRPTVCLPDDHDVYQGNIWGAGGRAAKRQDDGGYTMPARFVRMVERTQCAHLPDPADPTPLAQGIRSVFGAMNYGGISFAIVEDRKFKSAPGPLLPEAKVRNGWAQAEGFDARRDGDPAGAVLLGSAQLAFLDRWSRDYSGGAWMKVVLSQTLFANVATLPASARSDGVVPRLPTPEPGTYPADDRPVADMDSNGWPRSGRDRAVRRLRHARALHLCGDQHLGSVVRYGLEEHDDASIAFCVPSVANTWPRRWLPAAGGTGRADGSPRYTGRFRDGFGNRITVHAASNPSRRGIEPTALHDRAPGFGLVELSRERRRIILHCWPRAPREGPQYPGWPLSFAAEDCGPRITARLGPIELVGVRDPVVEITGSDGSAYTARFDGSRVTIPAPGSGPWRLRVHDGEGGEIKTLEDLALEASRGLTLRF